MEFHIIKLIFIFFRTQQLVHITLITITCFKSFITYTTLIYRVSQKL